MFPEHFAHLAHGVISDLPHAFTLQPHISSYLGHCLMFLSYAEIGRHHADFTLIQTS